MPDFRRGAEAIAKQQEKAKGGSFSPFAPELFWQGDGDEKYLLFLNPLADIPAVEMVNFIPQARKKANGEKYTTYERVIARTDPAIGEESDPMAEDWDAPIKEMNVAVAVELEPTLEQDARGRMRPTGFEIKTNTYERRIRDDEGNLTDDVEDVTTPVVGFIHASPYNFFNVVTAFDSKEGDIEATPVKIVRVGGDKSTTYTVTGYPDQTIDLAPLLDNIEGVSYLSEEEMDALIAEIDKAENDEDAVLAVGATLLDKRLDELSDAERYDKLYKSITSSLDKYGKGKKGDKKSEKKSSRERPARQSSRRSRAAEPVETEAAETAPEPEVAVKKTRARRANPTPSQEDPAKLSKIDKLRQRNEEHKAAATA